MTNSPVSTFSSTSLALRAFLPNCGTPSVSSATCVPRWIIPVRYVRVEFRRICQNRKTYCELTMSFRTIRESVICDSECRRATARLALKLHLSRCTKIVRFLDNHYIMVRRDKDMRCVNLGRWVRIVIAKLVCAWVNGFSCATGMRPQYHG